MKFWRLSAALLIALTVSLCAQARAPQPEGALKEAVGDNALGDTASAELPLYEERIPESLPFEFGQDFEGLAPFLEEVQRLERETDALLGEAEAMAPPSSRSLESYPEGAPNGVYREEWEALEAFESFGEAPILTLPNARSFPFGHQTPEIVCVPQRVCDIELEVGERYIDHRAGDHLNWQIVPGPALPENLPDHVSIRPRGFGLRTNLVLYTTKRTYHLVITSPEEMEDEETTYAFDQAIRFYYPDDWARRKAEERRRARAEAAAPSASVTAFAEPLALAPAKLNADYTIKEPWSRSRRLGWKPVTIFDDGERTFIALPEAAARVDLPVLLGRLPNGETYPLNPTFKDGWILVPTLFAEAEFRLGSGRRARWLRITNQEEQQHQRYQEGGR